MSIWYIMIWIFQFMVDFISSRRAHAWRISYFKKSHSPAKAFQVRFKCKIFTHASFLAMASQHPPPPLFVLQHPGSDDSLRLFFLLLDYVWAIFGTWKLFFLQDWKENELKLCWIMNTFIAKYRKGKTPFTNLYIDPRLHQIKSP